MEAHLIRFALGFAAIASMGAASAGGTTAGSTAGATVKSPNFVVTAPTQKIALQVAQHAEHYRRQLAVDWLGHELRPWFAPCPVTVKVGQMGAGGFTSFSFNQGNQGNTSQMEVSDWKMVVQGPLERILDSVIPHEVSHTIFACHFRRALPRWADEGAATLAEDQSEKRRQIMLAQQILQSSNLIPFRQLMDMMEYPGNHQGVLNLYAQGYTMAELLVQNGGKANYLRFLANSKKLGWDRALTKHYGYNGVDGLEQGWKKWVKAGCPAPSTSDERRLLVGNTRNKSGNRSKLVVRSQNPDAPEQPAQAKPQPNKTKKRRLVAPQPAVAARRQRPSGKNTLLTLTAAPTKPLTKPQGDRRYSNDGWIAVRTSGRTVTAKTSTTESQNRRRESGRLKPNTPKREQSNRLLKKLKQHGQARIPANRRSTR